MSDYDRLVAFAEHVRREAFHVSHDLFGRLGVEDTAAMRVAALGTEAANLKARAEMIREQEDIGDLDLSKLPTPDR